MSCIGDVRYLADGTRFDISFAVAKLAQFVTTPTKTHFNLLTHLVRYLTATPNFGIKFTTSTNNAILQTYSDSDYAESKDRRSISGAVHLAYGSPIMWTSRKQQTIALSTCEAEYVAASQALQDTKWITRLLSDAFRIKTEPTPFFIDNNGAIDIATHKGKTRRRKHIDIKFHHLQLATRNNTIKITRIPTTDNIADPFTKSLPLQTHRHLLRTLHNFSEDVHKHGGVLDSPRK